MAAVRVERRLAAILAADIVGYSRLMEKDEAGTFTRLKQLRQELIDPILQHHGGRFVDLKGDGAIVEFQSAVAAVEAAIAVQRAMLDRDPDLPENQRIRYRIGINLGDVIVDGETIFGDGINVAARIEALCEPGGIWLSRSVYNQVKGKLDVGFAATGLHQVKNISEAVETFRVALDGVVPVVMPSVQSRQLQRWSLVVAGAGLLSLIFLGGIWHYWPTEPVMAKPSIAILPLDNLSGDEATGRLGDGITEDIITDLARFRDLDVIARNSTAVYKGKSNDIRQIGRDLGVRYVLEGSIQRQGERIRVAAQLIDATTGGHAWADRWDRPIDDVFLLQEELAEQVANRLGGYAAVAQAGRSEAKRKRPEDLSAYELYLLGVEAMHRFTPQDSEAALRVLKQAVDADPQLARAWTALAWANLISTNWADDPASFIQAGMAAGRQAVQLDPADAEAQAVLGEALGLSGDLAQAKIQYERALSLNPGSVDILTFYSGWAADFGDPSAGMEAADKAIRLDPNYPVWAASVYFTYAYFVAGRYSDALKMVRRVPPENRSTRDYVFEASSLAMLGRQPEAHAAVKAALAHEPGLSVEEWAGSPIFSDTTRQKLWEAMRRAGFPLCASPDVLIRQPELERLPDCVAG